MIVSDLGLVLEPSGKRHHRVVVQCSVCKKHRETRISRVDEPFNICRSCKLKKRNTTHGLYYHHMKGMYNAMKQRCNNPNQRMYYRYGGRGIDVCDRWKNDFKAFYDWAISNGYERGLTIDRIDNDGNYEPSNCRWITLSENIARNAKLTNNDKDEICEAYKISNITQNELSLKYGVDASRIGQILKENNINAQYRGGIKKMFNKEDLAEILSDKRIAKEIAFDYGVHTNTIYKIKQGKYNVQ